MQIRSIEMMSHYIVVINETYVGLLANSFGESIKTVDLWAVTAAESFLNVTADIARDFAFGFRSVINMRNFATAVS